MELLTHSRRQCFARCTMQHHYRYELGITKAEVPDYFRIGGAWAKCHEINWKFGTDVALAWLGLNYSGTGLEHEYITVRELFVAHCEYHSACGLAPHAAEFVFKLPLVNPDTGHTSRSFVLAGKIDGVVMMQDGRLAVFEQKTAGEAIDADARYWKRIRIDPQTSLYVVAAQQMGYDVRTVIYDATRKPEIGWSNRGNPLTPDQWSEKLRADIAKRPTFYFQRMELTKLDDDIQQAKRDIWNQSQRMIRSRGLHTRDADRWSCHTCEFSGPCLDGLVLDPDHLPEAFTILTNRHPELEV